MALMAVLTVLSVTTLVPANSEMPVRGEVPAHGKAPAHGEAPARSAVATAAKPALQCCDPDRAAPVAPILLFGYGNPSRGDDALGPLLIDQLQRLQGRGQLVGVELLTDFQLQVEHVLDLVGRKRVILVDAAVELGAPYLLTPVEPLSAQPQTLNWTTHQLTPAGLARLFISLYGELPRIEQLAIGAEAFALGTALSKTAERHLAAASAWLLDDLQGAC